MADRVLLVMRHGRVAEESSIDDTVGALARTLDELASVEQLVVTEIWRADTEPCRWTTEKLLAVSPAEVTVKRGLGPPTVGSYWIDEMAPDIKALREEITARTIERPAPADALLVVGHEPALGWLLHDLVATSMPPPLASAEIACMRAPMGSSARRGRPWRVWWVLTPKDRASIPELREKVQSKMTAAALLAGFALAAAVQVLTGLDDIHASPNAVVWQAAGAALFAVSSALLVGAVLSFDRLMMPSRYWSEASPLHKARFVWPRRKGSGRRAGTVWRPPSSAGWVLYQESMRIWRAFVHSGLVVAALAGLCLAVGVALPLGREDALTALGLAITLTVATAVARHRPLIGVSD